MSFFISYPFFIPCSIGTLPIYIHLYWIYTYSFFLLQTRQRPCILPSDTNNTSLEKIKGCCVRHTMSVFSFISYSSKRGDKEHPGRKGMVFRPHEFLPSFQSVAEAAVSHSEEQRSHLKQGAYSHGVHNLEDTFCFSLHFGKTRTDLKENSV